jgi:tetratricopeptide (TPR) repeat protein
MKRNLIFILFLLVSIGGFSQKQLIENYDLCSTEIKEESKKQFKKAYNYYKHGKFEKSFPILRDLTEKEPEFASPYFILGMIGVAKDNPKMIEKYFPLVLEVCPNYSHPLLFYYLGMIDYSHDEYDAAVVNFEKFINATMYDESYTELYKSAVNYVEWCDFFSLGEKNKYPFITNKLEKISSELDITNPYVSLDEEMVFFVRKKKQRVKNEDSFYQQTTFTTKDILCQSRKFYDEDLERYVYEEGYPIIELENALNKPTKVSLTADKRYMYLSSLDKTTGKYQVYFLQCINGIWSQPDNVGNLINLNNANQIHPFVTPDGNTLYFASDREGGHGGYDIWVTQKGKDGLWQKPTNAGRRINSPGDEYSPYLHPDYESFYFSSNGWKGYGDLDLFYIDLSDINMKKPRNIGQYINSEQPESDIVLSKDGKTAYCVLLDSVSDNYSLVSYELPPYCRAPEIHLMKLKIIDKQMPAYNCKVDFYNLTENTKISYYTPDNEDNICVAIKPNDKYLIKIEKPSYAFFYHTIDLPREIDSLSVEIKTLQSGEVYPIENDKLFLEDFLHYLIDNPRIRIQLLGKSEETQQVQEYLIYNGVREDRVRINKNIVSDKLSYIVD